MTTYTVPDNPSDPETAALELIVRVPTDLLGSDSPPRDALQDFALLLHAENAFAGLSWHDARHAATAIIVDAISRDDGAAFLRGRAERILDGSDGPSARTVKKRRAGVPVTAPPWGLKALQQPTTGALPSIT